MTYDSFTINLLCYVTQNNGAPIPRLFKNMLFVSMKFAHKNEHLAGCGGARL